MDSSLPGSAIHGIFQARILEWAAISFSRGSSQPRDQTRVSCIADRHFTVWVTREAPNLLTKVHLIKAMVFPVVMYRCESWTIKKAECRIIDVFEPLCWRRLLWVPWTARRSNQSILKEIDPEYSLEGLMLKLRLQYYGHMIRADSLKKDPDARKDWWQEEKGRTEDEMVRWHHWLNGYEFEHALGDDEGQGSLVCCSPWGRKKSDMT